MESGETLRLATRGSALARRQAALVAERLERRRHDVELVTVETTGDQLSDELIHRLGTTGAFVRELDERVLAGEVHAAVHSLKDVPTEQPDELVVAAVPERATPADALVTPDGTGLDGLPEGATVGTASLRRRAQVLRERPDASVEPIRGNVDTRVEKLLGPHLRERGDDVEDREGWLAERSDLERRAIDRRSDTRYDALVLAAAGLERSGLEDVVRSTRLATERVPPAPGQGALAVTAAEEEVATLLHEVCDHPRSRVEATVERTILAELGGGCIAPVGIHAVVRGERVHTTVGVYGQAGEEVVTASRDLPIESHPEAAAAFAGDLADQGARTLIERAAEDGDAARREGEG